VHARGRTLAADVRLEQLAGLTSGWTGAALESLMNEAGFRAMRRSSGDPEICTQDFLDALHKRAMEERKFSPLDAVLVESASQLAEPLGPARAGLSLLGGATLEGSVVWASPEFIKFAVDNESEPRVIARRDIRSVVPLAGRLAAEAAPESPEKIAGSSAALLDD
jgi:hypothetical protein